jgi:hypothetical protein
LEVSTESPIYDRLGAGGADANPTLTIVALAIRQTADLAEELRVGSI